MHQNYLLVRKMFPLGVALMCISALPNFLLPDFTAAVPLTTETPKLFYPKMSALPPVCRAVLRRFQGFNRTVDLLGISEVWGGAFVPLTLCGQIIASIYIIYKFQLRFLRINLAFGKFVSLVRCA